MDLDTFSNKRKKEKKEEEEKDCWERHLCLTLLAGLIQPIVKKERRKEKETVFFYSL